MIERTVENTKLKALARHVPGFTTLIYKCNDGRWRAQLRGDNDRCWASTTFEGPEEARRWLYEEMARMWIEEESTPECGQAYIRRVGVRVGVHADDDHPLYHYDDADHPRASVPPEFEEPSCAD